MTQVNIFKIWYLAIRPKTLPAACGPVILGTGLAIGDGVFKLIPTIACLLVALLLQIGSNLANDVLDFKKGTDTAERTGPLRVTQAGLLTPQQVLAGTLVVFTLSAVVGIYLIYLGGWPIFVLGLFAIISAIAYTGGPFPLGYKGLADIFVFFFFGPVAVIGTYYLQAGYVAPIAWWASIPPGLLITAILVVNNLRDIDTDRKAGKKTLPVRFGVKFTRIYYITLLVLSYFIPLLLWLNGIAPPPVLLVWLTLPLAILLIRDIFTKKGASLNLTLAATAKLGLLFSIVFAVGYILAV